MLVSEENAEPIIVDGLEHARYACVFDPLDGYPSVGLAHAAGLPTLNATFPLEPFLESTIKPNAMIETQGM